MGTPKKTSETLIFVPTYNERENVERLHADIRREAPGADVLFLDDNSPDGTGELLDRMAEKDPALRVVHRPGKAGIGSAHLDGIRWAYEQGYRTLVTMDSDFTHPPHYIPAFLALGGDNDVVVGSRYMRGDSLEGWNLYRLGITRLGHLLTRVLLRMPLDATGAFRLYRLDRVDRRIFDLVKSRRYSFFFESLYLLFVNGCRIAETPITLPARTYGTSKMALRDILQSVDRLWRLSLTARLRQKALRVALPPAAADGEGAVRAWDAYWSRGTGKGFYDAIAAFYRRWVIRPALNRHLKRHFRPGASLLHAGCGGGQVDADASKAMKVTALDISEKALLLYAKANPGRGTLVRGSVFQIPLPDGGMDGVYNLGVMEHFTPEEIRRALGEFHRVLKAGGKAVLFWPPEFGLSVTVLKLVHAVLHGILHKRVKLHPDELTRVRSRRHARELIEGTGFRMDSFSFGPGDLFTQAVIVLERY